MRLDKKIEKEFQLALKEIRKISQEQIEKKSVIIELVKRLEQKLKYHQLSELIIGSVRKKKMSISVKVNQKETAVTAAKKHRIKESIRSSDFSPYIKMVMSVLSGSPSCDYLRC